MSGTSNFGTVRFHTKFSYTQFPEHEKSARKSQTSIELQFNYGKMKINFIEIASLNGFARARHKWEWKFFTEIIITTLENGFFFLVQWRNKISESALHRTKRNKVMHSVQLYSVIGLVKSSLFALCKINVICNSINSNGKTKRHE